MKPKKPPEPLETQQNQFSRGMTSVKDIVAPGALEVDFNHLKIGNTYFRTLFVSGYPRFVNANWLAPLINYEHSLDIAMYIYPIEGKDIMDNLRRKIGEMEAEVQSDVERGRIAQISTKVKLEDAKSLEEQLAKGAEHFFQFGLYITVSAPTLDELNKITQGVQSTLGALLIVTKTASLQMENAFKTTLPQAHDRLMITRNMDTTSLATTFPFTSSELTQNQGVLYGINQHNGSLIILDRFSFENANSIILAKSGAGKSFLVNEPVLYDDGSGPKLGKIGPLVERLICQNGSQPIDQELEGVINPGLKVYTFNQKLKAEWAKVTVAARKKSPKNLYRFTTASGRQITTTADHNLITIKNCQVGAIAGRMVRLGDYLPLARQIQPSQGLNQTQLNLFQLLKHSSHIYVSGFGKFIKANKQKLKAAGLNPRLDRYLYLYAQNRPLPLDYFYQIINFLGVKPTDSKVGKLLLGSRDSDPKTTWPVKINLSLPLLKLLGFYLAEGCCGPSFVSLSQNQGEVKNEVKTYLKQLKLNFFITPRSMVIPNRVFTEIIKALNLGSSAGTKKMPAFIFGQPRLKIAQLLRFYFEGDGTVDAHDVSAVSKSKQLISQITYLLLYFGIIARVRKIFKRASNTNHKGDYYWQLVISGADNLQKFKQSIGFVSRRKNLKLKQIISRRGNTNVDVIPSLESIFKELYQSLYSSSEIPGPVNLSPLKRGVFHPSPQELQKLIKNIEIRINQLEAYPQNGFSRLKALPNLNDLRQKIAADKHLNAVAWQTLGHSWQLMKRQQVIPGAKNVFRLLKTIDGRDYPIEVAKQEIYHGFSVLGASLQNYDIALWSTITQKPGGDTSYQRLINARQFLANEFDRLSPKISRAKELLTTLKQLAQADLFWDPVVKIDNLKAKQPYVYDLTVDNEVFLAGYAGMFVHNSYLVKLEALRSLMFDTEIIIIDPENEYEKLCSAVGGEYVDFSYNSKAKINPFDLSQVYEEGQNELGQKVLSLHSLFKVMMGTVSPQEEALLDRAIILTYKQKGITPDPATQKNEPPLLEDLYKTLIGMEEPVSETLAARLEKYVKGSFRGIFDQHTNIDLNNTFTAFSIRELEDALRPIAMFILLDFVWTKIKKDLKKRLLIVDEAWYMMKYPDSASFLYSMAKRARKYYLGLTAITQDVEDFLTSDYGKAIVTNSSIQILMKQSTASIEKLASVFYLSEGEKHLLLSGEVGHGLIFAGQNHVAIKVVASPDEHALITSSPEELLKQKAPPPSGAEALAKATPPTPKDTS